MRADSGPWTRPQTTRAAWRRRSSLIGGMGESSSRGTVMRARLPLAYASHSGRSGDFQLASPHVDTGVRRVTADRGDRRQPVDTTYQVISLGRRQPVEDEA